MVSQRLVRSPQFIPDAVETPRLLVDYHPVIMFDHEKVKDALVKATRAMEKVLMPQYLALSNEITEAIKGSTTDIVVVLESNASGDFGKPSIGLEKDGVVATMDAIDESEVLFLEGWYGTDCAKAVEKVFQILDFVNIPNTAIPGTRLVIDSVSTSITIGSFARK